MSSHGQGYIYGSELIFPGDYFIFCRYCAQFSLKVLINAEIRDASSMAG